MKIWHNCSLSDRITTAQTKLIKSLKTSKGRRESGLFLVEGPKAVADFLPFFNCKLLVAKQDAYTQLLSLLKLRNDNVEPHVKQVQEVAILPDDYHFETLSSLQSPRPLLALFFMEERTIPKEITHFSILLDAVQDPGNMGTIIRTASWFGVKHLFLNKGCVDPYSPKVVQASMGALASTCIYELNDAEDFLLRCCDNIPVVGTFLDGENIFDANVKSKLPHLEQPAILVLGNEGNGISKGVEALCSHRITIPHAQTSPSPNQASTPPQNQASSPQQNQQRPPESLNVSIAGAILLAQLASLSPSVNYE